GGPLPDGPCEPAEVVDLLARGAEPGLMAIGSGRFFGWVMGGTLPAGLAADWLVSAWDQNAGLRYATPAVAAIEEAAARWLVDLLGLPATADVGFATGATMANFTGLVAARNSVLAGAGWDVDTRGLADGPRVHVLVGAERHSSVDLALRYAGLGRGVAVAADDQGRLRADALGEALGRIPAREPVIVCLQAGNLHSGAFDPFPEAIALAHERGAWVHVDGAFGLWAAACAELRHLTAGIEKADSWATDAHKTLNVPYDCGIVLVADATALRSAFGVQTAYLIADKGGTGDPFEKVPEISRRARGVPVWAVLRSLGRQGVTELVARLATQARAIARAVVQVEGAEVLNDVVFTQVCIAFEDDERTRAITQRLIADGTTWMSGSRWRGRDVLRVSVSNWSTDEDDVRRSVEAVRRAASMG
ncbi:MAG: pyridoxal phosphate-dependent decarboxylase family protein, partial [Acidimicrobiales bacterium]